MRYFLQHLDDENYERAKDRLVEVAKAHGWHGAAGSLALTLIDRIEDAETCEFDLVEFLREKHRWSVKAFGPGYDPLRLVDHIAGEGGELDEVTGAPDDLEEWIDVLFLAFDGAVRSGHSPEEVCEALREKLDKNKRRTWPDLDDQTDGKRVEHEPT